MREPTTLRRGEARERLLELAERTVLDKGFGATSIEELIAGVGITKSAFFYHFKDKNDLAPTRGMIGNMVTSAKAVAASKAPTACQKPELAKAQAGLVGETEKVQKLVDAKADDAALKAAMKGLHDAFEVLEEGCNTGMKH